jgi:hypothetical protein
MPLASISITDSCHVGHTGTHLITEVKQRWALVVLGLVTAQMTISMSGAVKRCTHIMWLGKASEKLFRLYSYVK